jgi:subtilase family serine protease
MSRLRRILLCSTALAVVSAAALTPAAVAAPAPRPDSIGPTHSAVRYAVDEPVCAVPKDPDANRCFAVKRVDATKATPGAFAYTVPSYIGLGPANGYTPDDIAKAYGVNPAVNRSTQTVGIIDWYDDPHALADLDHFDTYYGLAKETATSFRKVNQSGRTSPLPKANTGSAGEIALDVESVRGLCHTCKILLVEANSGTDANLAAAENLAARLGATEISNSFGEAEHTVSSSVLAAYNHPGVVITASTGDDGWYAWDRANDANGASANAPEFPSSDPHVVAVGGTTLELNNDGSRYLEGVWNENGPDDQAGAEDGHQGAGGGGCSKLYAAPAWQAAYPGYSAAGCKGKRLAADISADADSASGLDVYLTYGGSGWETIGGTSLASPLVAAMFALAGGSHGAAYPASTLYANGSVRPSSVYDVTVGGNGFCAGDSTSTCGNAAYELSGGRTVNPNLLVSANNKYSLLDCSFPAAGNPATAPPPSSQCNAVTGYDGPSGLGTPNGLGVFAQTNPSVTLTHTALFRLRSSLTFTATVKEAVAGTKPVSFAWNWGDGHTTTTTSATTHHTYTVAGAHTVTLTETDNRHAIVIRTVSTSVGRKPTVHDSIPSTAKVHRAAHFSAAGSKALNTGSKLSRISWKFGDGHTSTATAPTHTYTRKGSYPVTLTVTDSSGVSSVVRKTVKVTS